MTTTALTLVNNVLSKLGYAPILSSSSFASQTDVNATVITNLTLAQNEIMLDFTGKEFLPLHTTKAYSVAIAGTEITLPTDIYGNRYKTLWVEDDDGENDGIIDIVSSIDESLRAKGYHDRSTIFAYPENGKLVFSEAATETHTINLEYIKQPTALTTISATCDIPVAYEDILVWKTLELTLEDLDMEKKTINARTRYTEAVKKVKMNMAMNRNDKTLGVNTTNYFTSTW